MAIKVFCNKCLGELTEPGALVFSPPSTPAPPGYDINWDVVKYHVCVGCFDKLITEWFGEK